MNENSVDSRHTRRAGKKNSHRENFHLVFLFAFSHFLHICRYSKFHIFSHFSPPIPAHPFLQYHLNFCWELPFTQQCSIHVACLDPHSHIRREKDIEVEASSSSLDYLSTQLMAPNWESSSFAKSHCYADNKIRNELIEISFQLKFIQNNFMMSFHCDWNFFSFLLLSSMSTFFSVLSP